MVKFIRYFAIGAILAMILPTAALAHGTDGQDGDKNDDQGVRVFGQFRDDNNEFRAVNLDRLLGAKNRAFVGTVTAVGSNSFTLKADNGNVYTVNTTSSTAFSLPFQGTASFASIHVNDMAKVKGNITGTVIAAASVVVLPANNHPAVAKGTVTAVSGSNLTLQTQGNNTVTVATNSNTAVTKADGTAGTTADVQSGAMVKIKGLWDSVLNVFTAIKIKLF